MINAILLILMTSETLERCLATYRIGLESLKLGSKVERIINLMCLKYTKCFDDLVYNYF